MRKTEPLRVLENSVTHWRIGERLGIGAFGSAVILSCLPHIPGKFTCLFPFWHYRLLWPFGPAVLSVFIGLQEHIHISVTHSMRNTATSTNLGDNHTNQSASGEPHTAHCISPPCFDLGCIQLLSPIQVSPPGSFLWAPRLFSLPSSLWSLLYCPVHAAIFNYYYLFRYLSPTPAWVLWGKGCDCLLY